MHENAHRVYRWEILFDSGKRFIGWVDAMPFDPNNPPKEYGIPIMIKLSPRVDGNYPEIPITIPLGAKPVCNRDVYRLNNLRLQQVLFRIGYELNNVKTMICVNAQTGEITFQS